MFHTGSIRLSPDDYPGNPEAQAFAAILSVEIEKERMVRRANEQPMALGLLGPEGYFSDTVPWFKIASELDLLTRISHDQGMDLLALVNAIAQLLMPPNWETFFWMAAWLGAEDRVGEREKVLVAAREAQELAAARPWPRT